MPKLGAGTAILDGQNRHHVEVHGFQLLDPVVIHQAALTHFHIGLAIGFNLRHGWILRMGTFMKKNEIPYRL